MISYHYICHSISYHSFVGWKQRSVLALPALYHISGSYHSATKGIMISLAYLSQTASRDIVHQHLSCPVSLCLWLSQQLSPFIDTCFKVWLSYASASLTVSLSPQHVPQHWICHRYLECLFIPDSEDTERSEMEEDLASYSIPEMVVPTLDIYEREVYSLFQRLGIELIDFSYRLPFPWGLGPIPSSIIHQSLNSLTSIQHWNHTRARWICIMMSSYRSGDRH